MNVMKSSYLQFGEVTFEINSLSQLRDSSQDKKNGNPFLSRKDLREGTVDDREWGQRREGRNYNSFWE